MGFENSQKEVIVLESEFARDVYNLFQQYKKENDDMATKQQVESKASEVATSMGEFICIDNKAVSGAK